MPDEPLRVAQSPCTSCPYRCDTPPGVWHPSEYEKLRTYDDNSQTPSFGVFLCHHSTTTKRDTVCRGWLTVHRESVAARIATMQGLVTDEQRYACVREKLYRTGNAAANAGMRGVARPGRKALAVIRRLKRNRK